MVLSLKESCLRILTAHSGSLLEVGHCPYRLIRPVLIACHPDQLAHIEDSSPHLMLESDEIWHHLLSKDFPNETAIPPSVRSPSPGPSHPREDEDGVQEVDLPANRLLYFKTRLAKEEALASASARLREKVQASRSDQLKRKAIFTGQTDYGIGSKKKKLNGAKSWGNYTPTGKTLAEKARQQVKKSAAVYANAVRVKAAMISTPNSAPKPVARPADPPRSSSTPIFSIKKPVGKAPTAKCVVRTPAVQPQVKVVQVPSAPPTAPSDKNGIKPTPFPKAKPLPHKGPLTTALRRSPPPATTPRPPARTPSRIAALLKPKTTSESILSAPGSIASPTKKTSSLFVPKKLKPPPKQPSKSLIFKPGSSAR
ncbi:hypothetical protein PtA15_7A677 [Puccinia triticina]|uniref:Elongin-A n=1 Tax=Puccinia triticina TaxID=208348 RepID=A0ABY7CNX4_9BASI|nr:uncharacterized protein PtA15_7A677 [Puccinia triticina]WAQ86948.1 hypothetical protein PtA15_7A677 [Puccinia triticina]WAR56812.1 hypothetical protein PtB15_7B663 [Puccinia triticina]